MSAHHPSTSAEENPQNSEKNENLSILEAFSELRNLGIDDVDLQQYWPEHAEEWLNQTIQYFLLLSSSVESLWESSPEFQKAFAYIIDYCKRHLGDISKIKTISISGGVLRAKRLDDRTQDTVNLATLWQNAFETSRQVQQMHERTQEQQKQLQEVVAKEAFYDGNMVFEYSLGTAVLGAGALTLRKGIKIFQKIPSAGEKVYEMHSVKVKLEDGTTKRIFFKEPYIGTKADFHNIPERIAQIVGVEYDPVTRKLGLTAQKFVQIFEKDIQRLTYERYKQSAWDHPMNEGEFEEFKNNLMHEQKNLAREVKAGRIGANKVALRIKHYVGANILFFPMIFQEFNRHQTAGNLVSSIAAEWLFVAGMKAGSRVPGWPIPKTIGSMAGGVAVMTGGMMLSNSVLETSRQKWLYFQKANYSNERSIVGHMIGGLGSTEVLGAVNDMWRTVSGNENQDGMDIGINGVNVVNPLTGNVMFKIPEVSIIQDKVTLGTRPWEWIGQWANRNVARWNEYVERYKISLTRDVNEILGQYTRSEGVFHDQSRIQKAGGKEQLLALQLRETMAWWESGEVFADQINAIINTILAEIQNHESIPNSQINAAIDRAVGMMKIDQTLYPRERSRVLDITQLALLKMVNNFGNITEEEKVYFQSFPERMKTQRQLYENPQEKQMYEKFLTSKTPITIGENQTISLGNYVALWLDKMVEYNSERFFLTKIQEGDKDGRDWKFF